MFNSNDRRLLHAVARLLDAVSAKLDVDIAVDIATLIQENRLMTVASDIKAQSEALLAKAAAETDLLTAISGVVTDVKAQNAQLIIDLQNAIENGAPPEELAAIAANLETANNALDANIVSEKVIAGTPADPNA